MNSAELAKPKLLVILGPTAVGKSALALDIAREYGAEIVSADSLQVYKYLDIGTAKCSLEERRLVTHHMIDLVEPDEEFNAGIYTKLAEGIIDELHSASKKIVVVGGTFLYVRLLLYGLIERAPGSAELREDMRKERDEAGAEGAGRMYERLRSVDPASADNIHPNDYVRIERALEVYYLTGSRMSQLQSEHNYCGDRYDALKIGLYDERERLRERVGARVEGMIERGLVGEVKGLLEMGYSPGLKPLNSIGYKEIISHLAGDIPLVRAIELIERNTNRLAKRQMTWLRVERDMEWFRFHAETERSRLLKRVEEFWK